MNRETGASLDASRAETARLLQDWAVYARRWLYRLPCTFPDERLWRIGGDTRVRYCYCQDYAIPVWCFVRDYFGDADAACFETGWVRQVAAEAATNGDGSFLGRRLKRLEAASPLYRTRLEGDRGCSLGMALAWGPAADAAVVDRGTCPPLSAWQDELHGASLVREKKRLASWCWLSGERPQGMCLPPAGSDLAEWRHGLSGQIRGLGIVTDRRIRRNCDTRFDGGFATCGRISLSTAVFISEGDTEAEIAGIDLAFAALPDGQTVVGLQHAHLHHRTVLRECKGLYLLLSNDCYNRYARLRLRGRDRGLDPCGRGPDGTARRPSEHPRGPRRRRRRPRLPRGRELWGDGAGCPFRGRRGGLSRNGRWRGVSLAPGRCARAEPRSRRSAGRPDRSGERFTPADNPRKN